MKNMHAVYRNGKLEYHNRIPVRDKTTSKKLNFYTIKVRCDSYNDSCYILRATNHIWRVGAHDSESAIDVFMKNIADVRTRFEWRFKKHLPFVTRDDVSTQLSIRGTDATDTGYQIWIARQDYLEKDISTDKPTLTIFKCEAENPINGFFLRKYVRADGYTSASEWFKLQLPITDQISNGTGIKVNYAPLNYNPPTDLPIAPTISQSVYGFQVTADVKKTLNLSIKATSREEAKKFISKNLVEILLNAETEDYMEEDINSSYIYDAPLDINPDIKPNYTVR